MDNTSLVKELEGYSHMLAGVIRFYNINKSQDWMHLYLELNKEFYELLDGSSSILTDEELHHILDLSKELIHPEV
jgi:hypothetical protein